MIAVDTQDCRLADHKKTRSASVVSSGETHNDSQDRVKHAAVPVLKRLHVRALCVARRGPPIGFF